MHMSINGGAGFAVPLLLRDCHFEEREDQGYTKKEFFSCGKFGRRQMLSVLVRKQGVQSDVLLRRSKTTSPSGVFEHPPIQGPVSHKV